MLFYDLLKAGIIELRKLCQIMHIGNYITQVLFQQHKVIFRGYIFLFCLCRISIPGGFRPPLIQASDHIINLFLTGLDTSYYLSGLDSLKGEDFVKLHFQLCNERFLVLLRPGSPFWVRMLGCRIVLIWGLESVFEVIVGYVIVEIVLE